MRLGFMLSLQISYLPNLLFQKETDLDVSPKSLTFRGRLFAKDVSHCLLTPVRKCPLLCKVETVKLELPLHIPIPF